MAADKISDGQVRAALIAAARTIVARDGSAKFSLKQLYAESGVGRTVFYRCFAGKADLFGAIVGGDVQNLGEMAEAMVPAQTQQVVGGVPATAVDAWLERRLRVFERALATLESRQEKSERELTRNISLLEEKLIVPVSQPLVRLEIPAVEAEPDVRTEPVAEPVIQPVIAAMPEEAPAPAVEFLPEPDEEPIGEREIQDFIAHARAAAKRAAVPPPPARGLALPRWIAWMGVCMVTLLICIGLALGNVARATQVSQGGMTYRQVPKDAETQLTALADSGDARAQTLLALAYLRGVNGQSDKQAAIRWSLAAAQQGEPLAQYLAGALLSKDDAPRAFSWFQQAALHGNLKAMHNLAIAYAEGKGTSEDDKRAAAWFGRAAAQGYLDSQFDLAVLFERGQGVTQNRIAALKWYLIAAAHGDGPAAARAQQLRGQMLGGEAARAAMKAAAYVPQPHDQLANEVANP